MSNHRGAEILDIGTHLVPHTEPTDALGLMGAATQSNAEFAALVQLADGSTDLIEAFHADDTLPDGTPVDTFDFRASLHSPLNLEGAFVAIPPEQIIKQAETLPGLEHPTGVRETRQYARYIVGVALGIHPPREGDYWDLDGEVVTPSSGERLGDF